MNKGVQIKAWLSPELHARCVHVMRHYAGLDPRYESINLSELVRQALAREAARLERFERRRRQPKGRAAK